MNWGWCPKDDAAILYAENDYNDIKTYIDNIKLHDGTATHIGMKYGVALLNPSSRDEFATLADRGIIENEYRTRPANFDDDVVKYIVLMTDGRTTDQMRPRVPNDGRTDTATRPAGATGTTPTSTGRCSAGGRGRAPHVSRRSC